MSSNFRRLEGSEGKPPQDCLHIEWPIGPLQNHTVVSCYGDSTEVKYAMTRLQLEPIGLVFLVFFMSILVIQATPSL